MLIAQIWLVAVSPNFSPKWRLVVFIGHDSTSLVRVLGKLFDQWDPSFASLFISNFVHCLILIWNWSTCCFLRVVWYCTSATWVMCSFHHSNEYFFHFRISLLGAEASSFDSKVSWEIAESKYSCVFISTARDTSGTLMNNGLLRGSNNFLNQCKILGRQANEKQICWRTYGLLRQA